MQYPLVSVNGFLVQESIFKNYVTTDQWDRVYEFKNTQYVTTWTQTSVRDT